LTSKSATIAFNSVAANGVGGGGVFVDFNADLNVGGTVMTVNTAFVQNNANAGPDFYGSVMSFGTNLIDQSAGSFGFSPMWGDILDPIGGTFFGPLAMNGGPTATCLPDMWAIND